MSNAIALVADSKPTIREDQLSVIKNTIAKGCSDAELSVFVQTCNRLGLDPFARQIFIVKRWDTSVRAMVASPQVSIDGFRLVAERTRQYRGQTAPEWCGMDGVWKDVWLSPEPPAAARVGVFREGFAAPLVRVARYDSYVQTTTDKQTNQTRPNSMWQRMPDVMLAKCAESLALRSAFPNELSGVYTVDEYPEPEQQQKTERPKTLARSLDDVASARDSSGRPTEPAPSKFIAADGTTIDSDGVVVEVKPAKPPYSVTRHIKALELTKAKHLRQWLAVFLANGRTEEEEKQAYACFKAKCLLEGLDGDMIIGDAT